MPKGKKFDAAEKHFMKKETTYKKIIGRLENRISELECDKHNMALTNSELSCANASLTEWIERLLEYSELPLEDIKTICSEDKKRAELAKELSSYLKFIPKYF